MTARGTFDANSYWDRSLGPDGHPRLPHGRDRATDPDPVAGMVTVDRGAVDAHVGLTGSDG